MLGPFVLEVVEAVPKWCYASLNLEGLAIEVAGCMWAAYHKLPHNRFAEVLSAGINSLRDQVSPVDMLFLHAPRSFLLPRHPLLL